MNVSSSAERIELFNIALEVLASYNYCQKKKKYTEIKITQ